MKKIILGLGVLAFMVSCNNDDDNPIVEPRGDYENGVIVLNEGGFGQGNASLSFIKDGELANDVFNSINETNLGDTAQSIGFNDNLAFIVLNGSNKVEVVNRYTLESVTTITEDLANPRYVAFANNKAYVTNWGDGGVSTDDFVTVINLSDYSTSTVSVVEGPEEIIEANNKLYVAHKGGYGFGNSVSIIDPSSNAVESTVTVGDIPNSLVEENGNVYVLCGGKPSWSNAETAGSFYKINNDNTAEAVFSFAEATHPSNLTEGEGKLFLTVSNGIYSMDYNATSVPTTPDFTTEAQGVYGIYGFGVNNGKIYVGDALDYVSSGKVYIYNTSGNLEEEHTVGLLPNGFYFNN